ncbi:armadillo-type protein [Catenaria anguillulae PL171]|uniref:Serine/threonine-protein kinase TOR n=1 Tax=Catenaria anguillulae PL171 TaxID=765915 RepID=A0A1Y2H8M9_9FUNG|nr:armadillo-type protein [Catenaria anguillulae PL171]
MPVNEGLDSIIVRLASRNDDIKSSAAEDLKQHVLSISRELTSDAFSKFLTDVNQRIFELILSNDVHEKVGGIMAIEKLIEVDGEENATKITRYGNYLGMALNNGDIQVMVLAARALGKLVSPRVGGAFTAEFVEVEVKKAIECLHLSDKHEAKKHGAVLVLKELAVNAPTLIFAHVPHILESLWYPLRDAKLAVRESAADALSVCLELVYQREPQTRSAWFTKVCDEALRSVKAPQVEHVHGSLLVIRELLLHTGRFMDPKYKEICDVLLRLKDHKDGLIRRTVILVIPTVASFNASAFELYLSRFMTHLIAQLKRERDRSAAFIAVGKVALAVESSMKDFLEDVIKVIRESLMLKGKARNEAPVFQCVSMLATSVGQALTKYLLDVLDLFFSSGISQPLVQALVDISSHIPPLLPTIQERLLNLVSIILSQQPFRAPGSPARPGISGVGGVGGVVALLPGSASIHSAAGSTSGKEGTATGAEARDTEAIILALDTVGSFDFGQNLNEFVSHIVTQYLEDDVAEVRLAAALTCCHVLSSDPVRFQTSAYAIEQVNSVLERLLTVAVADPDAKIRLAVLSSLDNRFDHNLAKAENVHSVFLATNDEVFANREVAMKLIGRLALCNPAHVLPFLRRMLIQLLTEFEYANVARTREECARLLAHLVGACRYLVKPYVEPILHVLLPKVKDASPGVASATLAAIGALALVSGKNMLPHMTELLPHIIESLSDASSQTKRLASLQTLGQIASATSYVIQPYLDHPALLDTIISILKTESSMQVRQETMKLLGTLGALDPYKHKQVNRQATDAVNVMNNSIDPTSMMIMGIGPSHEDYYPSVAINALMTICRDNSLSTHHTAAIKAVMFICRTLGLKCVPFLAQIIPPLLAMLRTSLPAMLDFFFQELAQLVQLVGAHMTSYLPDIIVLIEQHAKTLELTVMTLVESLAVSLESDFTAHLPVLLPHILSIFESDHSENHRATYKVLDILCIIGVGLQEYMFLVLRPLMRLIENTSAELPIRRYAVQALGYIIQRVNLSHHSSRIIHPLVRCLAVPDLRAGIMDALTALMMQMRADFLLFVPIIHKAYVRHRIQHAAYERCLTMQLRNDLAPEFTIPPPAGQLFANRAQAAQDTPQKLPVNQVALQKAWETSHKSTKDDWLEWLRRLSLELLKESPSPALRACSSLVSVHAPLARQLFNAAFVSCWSELYDQVQDELVYALETAITSPNIPPEILQTLLNLAEFMEHDDKALPIDLRTLGWYAAKCQAYAKALHYKELEFISEPSTANIESLISINNNLQQPDAAIGILTFAQQHHQVKLKENWYIKLERWEDGLAAYQRKAPEDPYNFAITLGIMNCLHRLGEWEQLSILAREKWINASPEERQKIAPFAAAAEWGLGHWDGMDDYINVLKPEWSDGAFFRAILAVHRNLFPQAQQFIAKTRELLDTEFTALVGESYNRSYDVVVRVQMLAELEEIIQYKNNHDFPQAQEMIRLTWKNRLLGTQRSVEVWDRMLKVRSVVLSPREDTEMWIKFSSLCRKSGRFGLSHKTLVNLLGFDPQQTNLLQGPPPVVYAYLKHMWEAGETNTALHLLQVFTQQLSETVSIHPSSTPPAVVTGLAGAAAGGAMAQHTGPHGFTLASNSSYFGSDSQSQAKLLARCHFRLAEWQSQKLDNWPADTMRQEILRGFLYATQCDKSWYKAWHAWALANLQVVAHFERMPQTNTEEAQAVIATHVVPALQGFVHSISLSKDTDSLQDTLRLLTLWFKYGNLQDVHLTIVEGFKNITIDTWLQVIPQLIARIHAPSPNVRRLIHQLLCDVGKEHPQALIYSLMVASKSPSKPRQRAALAILDKMRMYRADLVEQGLLVSQELIRVAILWHEQWHEALEEASRLYYGEGNADAMIATLEPLHAMMNRGPETLREISFHQMFGRDLAEAHEWCMKYLATREKVAIDQAWDLYFSVFKRIVKQLNQLTTLELQYISPALLAAKDLELAVPGTYRSGAPVIKIRRFSPQLSMFMTKQRPRRLTIHGDDGKDYHYLLKGHEDIRQDERVMQFFGLVNQLLENDAETFKRHLNIQRFPVIPLSPNSGLIGWVPHCDTLHTLIRDYRESRKILLNIEHRLMLQMAPDYDNLTLMQKIEVFEYALENTTGQDLYKVLWLKSKNSEAWLDRRTNYTRSLAVMSMVGYVLGLGDRHPSNLMLDRYSGKVVHIDFGDCFEVAMLRDKYPEKIPFRLTRMLINAMEVSGIEGSFRITSEHVMRVLRENKDSLMAVLEAFVHDPLINWRLMTNPSPRADKKRKETDLLEEGKGFNTKRTQANESELIQQDDENAQYKPEALNTRAVQVVHRVSNKLTGRDFKPNQVLDVPAQVDKLIVQATSLEHLCLCYVGWCPFW